jgi:hypothetical protein
VDAEGSGELVQRGERHLRLAPVNSRPEYDPRKRVYAWFHQPLRGSPLVLQISREVLEDYPAFAILHHLDNLGVDTAIRTHPGARLVVLQKRTQVVLEEVPGE